MSVLRLEHVTKRFGGLVAVNDLSFEVKERQIHALIGPNGSGKSTSINMINGSFPVTPARSILTTKTSPAGRCIRSPRSAWEERIRT